MSNIVGTEIVDHAADGNRIGKQLCSLSELSLSVDGVEFARVKKSVPVGEINLLLFHLWAGILEFFEEAPGAQIVVIGIDFAEDVADLDVSFKVISPMLFTA